MKTSGLAESAIRKRRADADFAPSPNRPTVTCSGAAAAPQLGMGEQFSQFRIVSGGSRASRFNVQAIAARRAGSVSPWQDQPEICKFGWSSV